MNEHELIEERKRKVVDFLRKHTNLVVYAVLALITLVSVWIRIQPMRINAATGKPGLWDITTDSWTLGPDLDPFLFLRWARAIVEHGTLYTIDAMRYVPLGFNTQQELILLPYMIAWFHKIASFFGSVSIDQSAVIFPVFMFALTVIAFYFMNYSIFKKSLGKNPARVLSCIAALLLSISPVLLPRTIAGIPEKESAAFLFLFLSILFFGLSWDHKVLWKRIGYGVLAGLSTALMALLWGGYIYAVITVGAAVLVAFLLGQINFERYLTYAVWFILFVLVSVLSVQRYSFLDILTSINTGIALLTFLVLTIDLFIVKRYHHKIHHIKFLGKTPREITSLIFTGIVALVGALIFLGPAFVSNKLMALKNVFIQPVTGRLSITVAENRQPYFVEWVQNFGPALFKLQFGFVLFTIGAIYLVWLLLRPLRTKERAIVTGAYAIFFLTFVFSRYSDTSLLNGQNGVSILFLLVGAGLFLVVAARYYLAYYARREEGHLQSLDFHLIMLSVFFLVTILSARSAIRLVMTVAPPAASLIALICVASAIYYFKLPKESIERKRIAGAVAILIALMTLITVYYSYQLSIGTASQYVPSIYTQQWQKAMSWVRDNTPENAVFAHWWDYGYWVQSIGKRATILDGGNAIGYWNHLIGRTVLTGSSESEALSFLYTHNATHLLIDSTDIGKYTAFASIGSNKSYDRRSWISAFLVDSAQTRESKNLITIVYRGEGNSVFRLDEDLTYRLNGTDIFLPGLNDRDLSRTTNVAYIGAITVAFDANNTPQQPQGIFVYKDKQYTLPLRYFYSENESYDFQSGVEAGIFVMPAVVESSGSIQIQKSGAGLFLSKRTVNTLFAKLYLYGQETNAFHVVHQQPDYVVDQLKSQGVQLGQFVYYNGVRGPITIWEIDYPAGMTVNQQYLNTQYPEEGIIVI